MLFLSCLYGSELLLAQATGFDNFLSCLYGSEPFLWLDFR
ncbi:hypothetical protein L292_1213 [Acinetobacter junii CIP 107470 = MTCC 11364]|uniref:Uncharacterized protein n=1 Tax=Acinetobacter junii CIP 107470 = MTCC 11364 TaxID=1217666 RepID=S7WDL2_ACIJU|nr:hypothetical protein L292_1213 [Acinetobacter junii CIP 107470 = MTCC 11364]